MTTTSNSAEAQTTWMELMGKDLIMRVVDDSHKEDDNRPNPEVGDSALIDISGHRFGQHLSSPEKSIDQLPPLATDASDDDAASCFLEAKDWRIVLGDADVPAAIEMAVRFMKEGQEATVRCRSKYAYGAAGRGVLPPYADVTFHVRLRSIWSQDEVATSQQQLQMALAKKTLGNDCFQQEWVTDTARDNSVAPNKCLKLYGKGAEIMVSLLRELRESTKDDDDDKDRDKVLEKEVFCLLTDCLNNIAAVHLRAKSYGKAKEAAANVLGYDAHNLKALCRAARAAMEDPATDLLEAQAALEAAEQDCLGNAEKKQVRQLRAQLQAKKRKYQQEEKSMYGKMFAATRASLSDPTASSSFSPGSVQAPSSSTTTPFETTHTVQKSGLQSTEKRGRVFRAVAVGASLVSLLAFVVFWRSRGPELFRSEEF